MKSTIEFTHGETTCASEPGKFCRWNYAKSFGTKLVCHLFDDATLPTVHGGVSADNKGMINYVP